MSENVERAREAGGQLTRRVFISRWVVEKYARLERTPGMVNAPKLEVDPAEINIVRSRRAF